MLEKFNIHLNSKLFKSTKHLILKILRTLVMIFNYYSAVTNKGTNAPSILSAHKLFLL